MRTIIDLTDEQLEALAEICEEQGISRAEAVRRLVQREADARRRESPIEEFFGIWSDLDEDSVDLVRRLRSEWDR